MIKLKPLKPFVDKINQNQIQLASSIASNIISAGMASIPLSVFLKKNSSLSLMIGSYVGILILYLIKYTTIKVLVPLLKEEWYIQLFSNYVQEHLNKFLEGSNASWNAIAIIGSYFNLKYFHLRNIKTQTKQTRLLEELEILMNNILLSDQVYIKSKL